MSRTRSILTASTDPAIGTALRHRRGRDERWVREVQLTLNAQPRLSGILPVFLALGAIALVLVGVGSLAAGFGAGWGFFLLALDALLLVGFTAWLARRPFPTD